MGLAWLLWAAVWLQDGSSGGDPRMGLAAGRFGLVADGAVVAVRDVAVRDVARGEVASGEIAGGAVAGGEGSPDPQQTPAVPGSVPATPAAVQPRRLGGSVPADEPYHPLTAHQRWRLYWNMTAVNPSVYARGVFLSIPEHLDNEPRAWGQGWGAYGKRVGSRVARITLSTTLRHGGAAALGHEPRYVRCRECTSAGQRLKHSFYYTFLTYNREGKPVFNYSGLAGNAASEVIAASWIPNRTWKRELGWGLAEQVSFQWLGNVGREFGPEIRRVFGRKK